MTKNEAVIILGLAEIADVEAARITFQTTDVIGYATTLASLINRELVKAYRSPGTVDLYSDHEVQDEAWAVWCAA